MQGEPATVLVGLSYPIGDLLLLSLTAGMLPILGWRAELRWGLMVAGFMSFAVADTVYLFQTSAGTYLEGTWVDACWAIASLFIAVAGWLPSSGTHPRPKPGLGAYVPAVLCGGVALAVAVMANQSRIAVALGALTLVAIAWRFAVTFRDVSAMAEAHRQAMTDELTGLPNRMSLATTLTAVTLDERSALFRTRASRALLLLDIDQFREINYFAGRHVGDQLLNQVAARLSRAVRPDDLIARTGGDAFAILLADGVDITTARARAGGLLEALRVPFELDPITVQIDASISIALCPDHCDHPSELLSCVETTMPHAKAATSKIVVHDVGRVRSEKDNDDYVVEELRAALLNDELTCFYQPKIRAEDGRVHSVEALLRWHHPTRGLLLPEEVLPAAERAGLMRQVAHCVINLALGQVRAWQDDEGIRMTVAVNLSMANLLDLDLVDMIERLLATHNVRPEALILEITEGTLANDSSRSRKTVFALRRLGVRISLDDYGTGWSSLARLQDLSVDELKLDRVFVSRLAQDPRSIAIVRSTVALAHSLGADLVAEAVEDLATLGALRRYGCTITQGFVHTPPLPADELLTWMATCTPEMPRGDLALHTELR
jgi:diguanylate cyclase (GGDEF)-like protein